VAQIGAGGGPIVIAIAVGPHGVGVVAAGGVDVGAGEALVPAEPEDGLPIGTPPDPPEPPDGDTGVVLLVAGLLGGIEDVDARSPAPPAQPATSAAITRMGSTTARR